MRGAGTVKRLRYSLVVSHGSAHRRERRDIRLPVCAVREGTPQRCILLTRVNSGCPNEVKCARLVCCTARRFCIGFRGDLCFE